MKSLNVPAVLAVVLSLVAISCGGGGGEGGSTTAASTTADTTFTVPLSAANEVPAITNADANATGTATITFHATKDTQGYVTSATADFQLTASGFPPGTTLTGAHIHPGGAGSNGGILVSTGVTPGTVPVTNGSLWYTQKGLSVPADQAQAILTNPAGFYFNIHTTLSTGGAARGQLGGGGSGGSGGGGGTPDPYAGLPGY